jgi:hypothetical protein
VPQAELSTIYRWVRGSWRKIQAAGGAKEAERYTA